MHYETLAEAARYYAELGYSVFPCVPGGKRPATRNGLLDATNDVETVDLWWTENPAYNVAIRTDGLLVVDVDGAENDWLADDPDRKADLVANCQSITPRGGYHSFFKGGGFRNTQSRLGPAVDTRGDGGYVIVPPSKIEGSGIYQWAFGEPLETAPHLLSPPPDWLVELLGKVPAERVSVGDGNPIPSGQRNGTLARIAGNNRRMGLSEAEIRALLRAVNANRCQPPLKDSEVDKIAWSISRYEPDQCTTAFIENHWAQLSGQQQDEVAEFLEELPEDPGEFPLELLEPRGLLGDVIDFINEGSLRPQPKLALAAAIALLGTITGRRVQDSRGTRTNVYCIGVASSGSGKEHARKVNKALLAASGWENSIAPESIGSHAGIVSVIDKEPVSLFQIDEFGRYIATVNDARGSTHLYKSVDVFLKLYSSASSLYIGDAYADLKNVKRIAQPHACLYGTTVPKSLFESLSADSLTDGFLGRLLIFEGDKLPRKRSPGILELPKQIVDRLAAWKSFGNKTGSNVGDLPGCIPTPYTLGETEDATAAFEAAENLFDDRAGADKNGLGALWARAGEKARKLALIHACSIGGVPDIEGGEVLRIERDSAEWGCKLASYLTAWIARQSVDWIAETPFHQKTNAVLRVIKSARDGLTLTALTYKTRGMTSRERQEALDQLKTSGLIVIETQNADGKGRPRTVYRSTQVKA